MPRERMHANKKLVAIDSTSGFAATGNGGLTLRFQDDSTASADVLVGADGIFGFVRGYILGPDHLATKPVPAGWAGSRNLVPFVKAKEKLGAKLFEEDRQYGWVGEGGLIMHDVLSNRTMTQCVGTLVDKNPSTDRKRKISRESLEDGFAAWMDGPVAKGMIDVSCSLP